MRGRIRTSVCIFDRPHFYKTATQSAHAILQILTPAACVQSAAIYCIRRFYILRYCVQILTNSYIKFLFRCHILQQTSPARRTIQIIHSAGPAFPAHGQFFWGNHTTKPLVVQDKTKAGSFPV